MWTIPQQWKYDPPGKCIYCGAHDCRLTDEHIIAIAIGGKLLFEDASCENCQKIINEQFEGSVLGFMLHHVRAHLGLKSRKSKKAKNKLKISY